MKEKIIQCDNFALNISEAYTHKTLLGGIFSIFYTLVGLALVVYLVFMYATQPDQISTKVLYDYNLPIASPDKDSFNLTVNPLLTQGTSENMKTFVSYFRFYLSVERDSGQRAYQLVNCNLKDGTNQCSFELPFSSFYDAISNQKIKKDSFQLGYITCKELKEYEDKKIIIVNNPALYEGCIYTYDIFDSEWMKKSLLEFSFYLLHHYFEYPEIADQVSLKKYTLTNRLDRSTHDRYSMDMNYANIFYNNYLFFGSSYNRTIFNWVDPEKITQAKKGDGHTFTIIFSNRFKSRVFYYTIEKASFSSVLINLGGILKIYGLLTFIPYLWNNFYREKALLVLCTMFHFKSLTYDERNREKEPRERSDSKGIALVEKENEDFDWHNYSFGLYLKTKYCSCFCAKELKRMKDKILASMECTSFVKFGQSKKWVDIAKYMPCYQEDKPLAQTAI